MGQKITALHIDMSGPIVKVRALSKTRRGTRFTLHAVEVPVLAPGSLEKKLAVQQAIEDAILVGQQLRQ